jgi:hypothetical protein
MFFSILSTQTHQQIAECFDEALWSNDKYQAHLFFSFIPFFADLFFFFFVSNDKYQAQILKSPIYSDLF